MAILDQFGNEYKPRKSPDRNPLGAAPIMEGDRQYIAGLTPLTLASWFRAADAGDITSQAHLYEQMLERDGHLVGETSKRKNVITDVQFSFTPADDSQKALDIADFCEQTLKNITDWPDVLVLLQDAVGKGFSAPEIKWDVSSGQAVPYDFEEIKPWRFRFADETGYLTRFPRLLSDTDLMGSPIPAWKVLFHRHNAMSGNATRNGIYRICAWMFVFKNYAIKDLLTFTEVYGMPLRVGKYDPGASADDKTALRTAVRSIGSDAAGIISKATEIDFIETIRGKDGGELYIAVVDLADRESSKALLGQHMTSGLKDVGSFAAVKEFNGIREDLVKSDSRALASTIRQQLIRPLVGFNYGWDQPLPKYEAIWDEDEDLGEKAEWVDKILQHTAVPRTWLFEQFKIPEPESGEEMVGGTATTQENPPQPPFDKGGSRPGDKGGSRPRSAAAAKYRAHPAAAAAAKSPLEGGQGGVTPPFAKGGPGGISIAKEMPPEEPEDVADQYLLQLEESAGPVLAKMLAPVFSLVKSAASLEEIRDRIFDLYPAISSEDMADLMTQAAAASHLAGRYEINLETEEE